MIVARSAEALRAGRAPERWSFAIARRQLNGMVVHPALRRLCSIH